MTSRSNTVVLDPSIEDKVSKALYVIKELTSNKTKSVTFQNNIGILNLGGTNRVQILLPTNASFQLISMTELDELYSEINMLKVNLTIV